MSKDKTKEDNQPTGPARLLDIAVDEVSLVDRAANRHKFLVVKQSKRGDKSMEVERVKQTTGDEPVPEATSEPTAPVHKTDDQPAPAATSPDAVPTDASKAGYADVKPLMDALGAMKPLLEGLMSKLEAAMGKLGAGYPAPAAKATESVEKAGAKISQHRMEKIMTAYQSLKAILDDLGVDVNALPTASAPVASAPVATQPPVAQPTAKADTTSPDLAKAIGEFSTQISDVVKRLETIEGAVAVSKQPGQDGQTTEVKKGDKGFWGNVV